MDIILTGICILSGFNTICLFVLLYNSLQTQQDISAVQTSMFSHIHHLIEPISSSLQAIKQTQEDSQKPITPERTNNWDSIKKAFSRKEMVDE